MSPQGHMAFYYHPSAKHMRTHAYAHEQCPHSKATRIFYTIGSPCMMFIRLALIFYKYVFLKTKKSKYMHFGDISKQISLSLLHEKTSSLIISTI